MRAPGAERNPAAPMSAMNDTAATTQAQWSVVRPRGASICVTARASADRPRRASGRMAIMCKNRAMRRHEVAVLALDQVTGFDLGTPTQVLGAALDEHEKRFYRVRVCTPGNEPVRTSAGYTVQGDHGLELLAEVDTIIVAGQNGADRLYRDPLDEDVALALVAAAPTTRIVSICT